MHCLEEDDDDSHEEDTDSEEDEDSQAGEDEGGEEEAEEDESDRKIMVLSLLRCLHSVTKCIIYECYAHRILSPHCACIC